MTITMEEIRLPEQEWYWHSLYFHDEAAAQSAYRHIRRELDGCADMSTIPYVPNPHLVTFSTDHELGWEDQQQFVNADERFFNADNSDYDDEELLEVFRRPTLRGLWRAAGERPMREQCADDLQLLQASVLAAMRVPFLIVAILFECIFWFFED